MKIQRQLLFCPGPVNIASNVLDATRFEIGHREKEFSTLIKSMCSKLLKLYEIENTRAYHPVFITGSGTAANEAVLSSVVHDKNILVVSNGEFGERLYEISKIHNPNTFALKFPWAKEMDLSAIETYIKLNRIEILAMVHHETSTGMINPIHKIGKIAKKYNLIFIVDTISSVGAEKINIEKSNITYTIGTSGKAVGSLPGVAFVIARKKDFESLKNNPPKTSFLNLYKFYYYSSTLSQTPNTPAVQLFFALEQALKNIHAEGISKRRKNLSQKADILRTGMKKLGLSFHIKEEHMSSVLTTVTIPKYIDFNSLKTELKKKNIIIYNGKGTLTDKVFQVGNIGEFSQEDILYFLNILKEILMTYKEIYKQTNQANIELSNNTPLDKHVYLHRVMSQANKR